MKDFIYERKVGTQNDLIRSTSDEASRIADRDSIRPTMRSVMKRARMCNEGEGEYFNICDDKSVRDIQTNSCYPTHSSVAAENLMHIDIAFFP
jgi:hypothetical protein